MDDAKSFWNPPPSEMPQASEMLTYIRTHGKENYDQEVYRITKSGCIDEKAFLNSYEERISENRDTDKLDLNDVGTYSTSCHLTEKSPNKLLKCLKKKHFNKYPHPEMMIGHTIGGLSQQTIERYSNDSCSHNHIDRDHIDWWIYKDEIHSILSDFKLVERPDHNGEKNEK